MKQAAKFFWVPLGLAMTLQFTFSYAEWKFDLIYFLFLLLLSAGHFYIGGFFARKYLSKEPKSLNDFWLILSLSYVPFILGCWGRIFFGEPIEPNEPVYALEYVILGSLASLILYTALSIKKVGYDLDAVLAVLAISLMTSAIWDVAIGFLIVKLYL